MKGVKYKDNFLAYNSEAYHLWDTKSFKELDRHLKELDQKEQDLLRRYTPKTETEKNVDFLKQLVKQNESK